MRSEHRCFATAGCLPGRVLNEIQDHPIARTAAREAGTEPGCLTSLQAAFSLRRARFALRNRCKSNPPCRTAPDPSENLQGRMAAVTNEGYDSNGDLESRERTSYNFDSKSYRVKLVNESEGLIPTEIPPAPGPKRQILSSWLTITIIPATRKRSARRRPTRTEPQRRSTTPSATTRYHNES